MGLASKLAASQGTGGPAGYPQSYPPPQAQTGSAGYPGQQQYQTYHPQQPAQQQNYQQPQLPAYPSQHHYAPSYDSTPISHHVLPMSQYPHPSQAWYPPHPAYGVPAPSPSTCTPPITQLPYAYPFYISQPAQSPLTPIHPQQQYGANPPYPSRPQAQVPSPGGPVKVAAFKQALQQAIHQKGLHNFPINNAARLDAIAARAPQQIDEVCNRWRVNREIANDIVRLALYDIVIFVDDSGSMSFEEGGERIKDLELILTRVAFAATLFDDDGISIRFMNDTSTPGPQLDHITSEKQVMGLLNGRRYKGLTPLGTQLRKQVVDGMVLPALSSGRAEKPYLVIVITDGQPAGESPNTVQEIIQHAVNSAKASHGTGAIAFEFAQVGNDQKATEFLSNLDNHQIVGSMVDCTSNFENESAECARAQPPVDLTPDLWVIKLLLGAIDPSYDDKDEKSAPTGYTQAPPSQYIQPPPGQPYSAPASQSYYGGPQQQAPYGQQPPYGQQAQQQGAYGGPPPGQYGQQPPSQYGQPPSGPPPGQYGGQPPQQYGARPPGGQAPPYPPRY